MSHWAGTFKIIENWEIIRKNNNTQEILDTEKFSNIIVNDGKNLVRNWLAGDSVNPPDVIGIGVGTTSAVATDTSLENELDRATATITKPANYQVKYAYTFSFASAYDITEAGLFDSLTVTGSLMFNRVTFTAKEVDTDIDLIVNCTITVSTV